eukprot:scaffold62974_cov65-Phaeocystis_antarctica.AAC.2
MRLRRRTRGLGRCRNTAWVAASKEAAAKAKAAAAARAKAAAAATRAAAVCSSTRRQRPTNRNGNHEDTRFPDCHYEIRKSDYRSTGT